MTNPKLFLHFGAHKTATTSLQMFFHSNQKRLKKSGITYIMPSELNNQGLIQFLHGHPSQPLANSEAHAKFLANIVRRAGTPNILISHESFFSYAGDPRKAPIYPTAQKGLERLKLINCFREIRMAFTLREPAAFLQSIFLQNLGNIFTGTLGDYLEQIDVANLSWLPLYRKVEEASLGHVNWFVFEDLKANGARNYLETFSNWLDFSLSGTDELPRVNESLSAVAAKMLSASGLDYKNMEPELRFSLRSFLVKNFPESKFGKADFLKEEIVQLIRSQLETDHRDLLQRIGRSDACRLWGYAEDSPQVTSAIY